MRNADLILEVAKNMQILADSLIAAVNGSGKKAASASPPEDPAPIETSVKNEVPSRTYTKEEARDILISIRAKGFNDQIREILTRHGFEKFTAVPQEEYPAIIAEAEALVNATS